MSYYFQAVHAVGAGGCRRRFGQDISVWSRWLIWHAVAWREPLWQRKRNVGFLQTPGTKVAPRIKVTLTKIFTHKWKCTTSQNQSGAMAVPSQLIFSLPVWNSLWSNCSPNQILAMCGVTSLPTGCNEQQFKAEIINQLAKKKMFFFSLESKLKSGSFFFL